MAVRRKRAFCPILVKIKRKICRIFCFVQQFSSIILGQNFLKNLSPFASRKADSKASKPPLPDDVTSSSSGVNGIHARQAQLFHNNGSLDTSNPPSPLLLNRKTFDIADESQYKHLQGNTSPIGMFQKLKI